MSMYQGTSAPATDDYAIFPNAVAVEPEPAAVAEQPKAKGIRRQGVEFYKPFHYLLLVYLFFYCSRFSEFLPWFRIGLLLQPILLIGMFMTGTGRSIFKTDIGKAMIAFTVWVAVCVPLSSWPGGSFQIFILAAQALLLLFFMAAFIQSIEDCYRVMYVVAIAMAAIGVLSFVIGGGKTGDYRAGLGSQQTDTLVDANFLALYLILGLPFLWFSSTWKKGIVKIGVILLMLPTLAAMSRTGSRMGLLALAAGTLFFLKFANSRQRATIIIGGTVGLVLAVMLLPSRITERFTTLFGGGASTSAQAEAASSAEARKTMFWRSVQLTFEHPLFGVGPGEFMDAEAAEDMAVGKRGLWHYTHNAYTELSSETGLPGMAIFVFAFWRSYKGLSRSRDSYPNPLVRRAALCIQIAVLVSAVGAFFLSIAYSGILYAIMGISSAFQLAAARQYKLLKAQEA
jgi:putative inorganic carbon (hco3(-)) transporter